MATTNNKQLTRLKGLLKDLFQLDQPELDFGLYKIMHAKSVQITRFLENDLLKEIETAFGARDSANAEQLFAQAKAKLFESLGDAALDANGELNPTFAALPAGKKYLEDMANAQAAKDSLSSDAEIYDHLYRFFERYYDNGDFLSRRYYARESDTRAAPYSVPYDGREVYLHWANKDQYYIKSGENFTHYTFDLIEAVKKHLDSAKTNGQDGAFDFEVPTTATGEQKPMKVHLRIAEAQEGEHGNIKASSDQKREFTPLLSKPAELDADGSLVLNFEYKVLPEGYPFDEAAIKAKFGSINKEHMPAHWMADEFLQAMAQLPEDQAADYMRLLSLLAPTDKQTKRTLLAKYISLYTARNTMDYFIHKDLGGFLYRELDFFIKNEVMRLDDIENADAPKVEQYLGKVKVLRRIAHQLIAFLAQLENFQKRLWLKKKFVTESQYCITLNRIPESMYPYIALNDAQREEWVKIFAINKIAGDAAKVVYSVPLTVEFLKGNPFLPIDTKFFSESLKGKLIEHIENIDMQCDGVLLRSENYQGLNFIQKRFKSAVKCAYIDPPYNTGDDGFPYKDNYKSSSWLSMMSDRLSLMVNLLKDNSVFFGSIDERELLSFDRALKDINMTNKFISVKMSEASGLKMSAVAKTGSIPKYKEFLIASSLQGNKGFNFPYIQKNQWDDEYNKFIDGFDYSIYEEYFLECPAINQDKLNLLNASLEKTKLISANIAFEKYSDGLSINEWRIKNSWRIVRTAASSSVLSIAKEYKLNQSIFAVLSKRDRITYLVDGSFDATSRAPRVQILFAKDNLSQHPGDFWGDISTTGLEAEGGVEFKNGKKPLKLLNRILELNARDKDFVLDFFSGSGTTFESLINLNTLDGHRRKFIGIEHGEHFYDVLLKRLKLSVNTAAAKAKPDSVGYLIKYLNLESYEDTLNNLSLRTNPPSESALDNNPELRRDYVLNYCLNVETQGSQSLLNVSAFRDPTAYTMHIRQPGSDVKRLQRIDLIETFNWLLGLWVEHLAAPQTFSADFEREVDQDLPNDQNTRLVCKRLKQDDQGPYWFRLVEGYTLKIPGDDSSRHKTLVVWRKLTDNPEQDNAALQKFLMEKLQISPRENTYDVIYVNGSHTLPNPLVEAEQTKVRLIEEAFHAAMWSQEAI